MSDIFISYKREEQPIARKLATTLESEGWTVWWDWELRGGEYFDDVIQRQVNEARCVIVIWSESSVQSQYVKAEAAYAQEHNKLIPVRIDGVSVPLRFRLIHTLSLLGWDGSKGFSEFRRLVDDIRTILGPSPTVLAAEQQRRLEADQRSGEEVKQKADDEKPKNHAPQEARAQRTAEKEHLREQERQQSEEEAKRKTHANRHKPEKEKIRSERETEQSREKGQRSSRKRTPQQNENRLQPGTVFHDKLKDGSHGPEMVVIPAGTFQMGDNFYKKGYRFELPVHTVRIPKPFAMGRYEVTFEEYDRFAAATRRKLPGDKGWGRGRLPVINVSWNDATNYAEWLSQQTAKRYRLPSEAEWEYAARAGTTTVYWWGNVMEPGMANYNERGILRRRKPTLPVGSFQPNLFGLYDTVGNVWEWVQDYWHRNYDGAPTDGSEWYNKTGISASRVGDQRVFRGGCWGSKPRDLRVSQRNGSRPDARYNHIGFRLAREIG
jgi:formylglycine-generating enzyme required for sulfatase activity